MEKNVGNDIFSLRNGEGKYLAKSSFSSRTNSSAVHWSESVVKPQMSANKMLKRIENCNLYLDIHFRKIGFLNWGHFCNYILIKSIQIIGTMAET